MSLKPLILRLMLCLAFVLASSYAQAIAHVDDAGLASKIQVAKTQLPPCHRSMKGERPNPNDRHHDGCCSNFACAIGLITENVPIPMWNMTPIYDADYVTFLRSAVQRPLNPPPKLI